MDPHGSPWYEGLAVLKDSPDENSLISAFPLNMVVCQYGIMCFDSCPIFEPHLKSFKEMKSPTATYFGDVSNQQTSKFLGTWMLIPAKLVSEGRES